MYSIYCCKEINWKRQNDLTLTVLQFAVVPDQTVIWIGVTPGAMFVPVWVPAVVLVQAYMGFCRVRIPTAEHTNTDSHIPFVISHTVCQN